jgi:hypothetical protein
MQNFPNSSPKLQAQSSRPNPKLEPEEFSFTSFTPLSPEASKGSFSLSKLFQWKSSEPRTAPKARGENVAPNAQGSLQTQAKNIPTLSQGQSSPSIQTETSWRKVPRSWSSPRFQRRQGSVSPGQGKYVPQGYRNLSALFKRLSAVADYSKGDQVLVQLNKK